MTLFNIIFLLSVTIVVCSAQQQFQIPHAQSVFSSKLYQSFLLPTNNTSPQKQAPQNLVYSPFSIHTVLSMTMIGARNETFNEMALALGFPQDSSFIALNHPDNVTLFEQSLKDYSHEWSSLITTTNDSILSVANGIYIEKSYPLSVDYLSLIRDDFHSNVKSSDFSGNAENERVQINQFVSDRTNQLIKELIPLGAITSDTKLVLVNAIYFLGEWQTPFSKDMTINATFKQLSSTDEILQQQVAYMNKRDVFEMFGDNDEYNWLTLPYSNPNYQMTFIAPKFNQPFSAATDKNFDQFVANSLSSTSPVFTTTQTNMRLVRIPKFKIEFESELSNILKDENGDFKMITSFERESANFSAMIEPNPLKPLMQLWIDKVFHKAFIRVDELGTEAAAATATIIVGRTTSIVDELDQRDFVIDRPFAFVLKRDDVILFVGKVNKLY